MDDYSYETKRDAIVSFLSAKEGPIPPFLVHPQEFFEGISMLFIVRSKWAAETYKALRKLKPNGWHELDKVKDRIGSGYLAVEVVAPGLISNSMVSYKGFKKDKGSLMLRSEGRSIDCIYECGSEVLVSACPVVAVADCESTLNKECMSRGATHTFAAR